MKYNTCFYNEKHARKEWGKCVSVGVKKMSGARGRARGAEEQRNSCLCDRSVGVPRTGDGSDAKIIFQFSMCCLYILCNLSCIQKAVQPFGWKKKKGSAFQGIKFT